MKATYVIRDEHRSIAAVLQGLRYLATEMRFGRMEADFALLDAMLRYIEGFPERLHHPKEDKYLFPVIRRLAPELDAVIDELEQQHESGRALIRELRESFEDLRSGVIRNTAFADVVERYVEFHWKHMRLEEDQVLVFADQRLPASDAQSIEAAFESNDDPLSGISTADEFRDLFKRIANLAPPPIGVGPPAKPSKKG
jgi:hemerythrin-like domain-containing protein